MTTTNTTTTGAAFELKAFDRNRYFYGKLMMARDFEQEQAYFNSKRWLINRLLFGRGVVCGLEVRVPPGGAPPEFTVSPGVAMDARGREVIVPSETKVKASDLVAALAAQPAANSTHDYRLCISYEECPQEPVPSVKGSACEQVCDFNRVREGFSFRLLEAEPAPQPPTPCDRWMNRRRQKGLGVDFEVERLAPLWVRPHEVFEVAVKVTASGEDLVNLQLSERVLSATGAPLRDAIIEPPPTGQAQQPSHLGGPQFPTVPVSLRKGEFFVYVYQVAAPASGKFTIECLMPRLEDGLRTTIEVVSEEVSQERAAEQRLKGCDGVGLNDDNACVEIAEVRLTVNASGALTRADMIRPAHTRRFRYTLERAAELLECVRASLLAEAGSQRPGHSFVTFKDLQLNEPQPVKPRGAAGTAFNVARADHVHRLDLAPRSALKFNDANALFVSLSKDPAPGLLVDDQNNLLIEGDVGGKKIRFLNTVTGKRPTAIDHLATKGYVDQNITHRLAGLDWQESVLDKDLTSPPALRNVADDKGKRYLLFKKPRTGVWADAERDNNVAEWTGTRWAYSPPDPGTAVFVDDEKIAYLFVNNVWQPFLATPEVTAGPGLRVAGPAVLGVNNGPGVLIGGADNDQVTLDYESAVPQPVAPTGRAGTSPRVAHADHVHALPLNANTSGLAFDAAGLRVATSKDGGLAVSALGVGVRPAAGGGILVDVEGVRVGFQDDATQAVGTASSPGKLPASARTDHVHALRLATNSGVLFDAQGLRIDFEAGTPQPVAPVGRPGSSPRLARADHAHALPVMANGGVLFDTQGLRIDFEAGTPRPVSNAGAPGESSKLAHADHVHALAVAPGGGVLFDAQGLRIDFEPGVPRPVARAGAPGASARLARADHVHALPIQLGGSGLELDARGLRVSGSVTDPVAFSGQVTLRETTFNVPPEAPAPVQGNHLTTKAWVDVFVRDYVNSTVAAKVEARLQELDWQESVLDKDLTAPPAMAGNADRGKRYLLFARPRTGDWAGADKDNQIAQWTGAAWAFTLPDPGTALFVEDEAKLYVFMNNVWSPFLGASSNLTAGEGLGQSGNTLNVQRGDGVALSQDNSLTLDFALKPPPEVGVESTGQSPTVARGDHTHALPEHLNSATGTVELPVDPKSPSSEMRVLVEPGLGTGLVSVVVGMEGIDPATGQTVGATFGAPELFDPIVRLGAAVIYGTPATATSAEKPTWIMIIGRFINPEDYSPLPRSIRVRWFAHRVGPEKVFTDTTTPPSSGGQTTQPAPPPSGGTTSPKTDPNQTPPIIPPADEM